ncbi:DNA invertase Pin-like site-specific DNA recombinase [Bradyrhizobium sp. IAR9]|uniref:recombinase family protein n=1 Tax=Bradyrhizobium sp. IAR9 TaxID=2663841 RepID=UPI0015CEBFFE|nr:recombinase family protein [Bradyrhizobium sp. IAR9]NYG46515.1 DNA invertase Pin-like site-specific DNA recombinase [Bradyrhizobium sp. IAR9]
MEAKELKLVAYTRVSTQKQGRSGLGLEAQKADIENFALARGGRIVAEFTEVESGKNSDRGELLKAIRYAKITGAVLVIAKLDRLSRSASFTLTLRDSGVRFLCCDMPEANDLTIGVLAVVAQAEAEAISRRTRDALGAARKRIAETGQRSRPEIKRLGNPNGAEALRRAQRGNSAAVIQIRRRADQRAKDLASEIEAIRAGGAATLAAVAHELNRREIVTARGRKWHASSVANLESRLKVL